jgi:hypothetical protein
VEAILEVINIPGGAEKKENEASSPGRQISPESHGSLNRVAGNGTTFFCTCDHLEMRGETGRLFA